MVEPECTCGRLFRDGEDYRDHLPCEGKRMHVLRSSDVDDALLKLLVSRLHGSVSFTEQDLQRAKQLEVEVRWDGHRYTLSSRWP